MSAKEMFEALGFEYNKGDSTVMCRKKVINEKVYTKIYTITFADKGYEIENRYINEILGINEIHTVIVPLPLHQAIHQQMKELGWLE